MSAGLHLRLSQQLRLTPQLLQSIRLLQLSTTELQQEIESVVLENPLLEREDDPLASHLRIAPSGAVLDRQSAQPGADAREAGASEEGARAGDDGEVREAGASSDAGETGDWGGGTGNRSGDDDGSEGPRDWAASAPGLEEHLLSQLSATTATPRDRALVAMLISDLDDRGYLRSGLAELRGLYDDVEGVEEEELDTALRLLQSFDPPGVGARSPAECLRIQIDQLVGEARPEARELLLLARAIATQHLDLLATHDFARLRRALGIDEERLRAAFACIVSLNPFPGSAFGGVSPSYIVPDIRVRRIQGRWVAEINPEVRPRLRIHRDIAEQLRRLAPRRRAAADPPVAGAAPAEGETDWPAKVRDATQFIRNLEDRFETIRRVAQAVVERQSAFFSHGAIAMRPLVRREIASLLELNESTVSRATANKYMATPFGVFELRYFFASHVATDSGGEASSTAIRELISQLVGAEDPTSPLPDGRIAQMLAEQGMVVARRTVAKYREQLRIAPANLRRKMA
jgi:RNA polymerase sigma-54 factor